MTFYSQVKSQARVLNAGLEIFGVKTMIYKVLASPLFVVAYTNESNTC